MDKYKAKVLELESEVLHRIEKAEQEFRSNPLGGSGSQGKATIKVEDIASKHDVTGSGDVLRVEFTNKLQEMIDGVYRDMRKQNDEERFGRLMNMINELTRRHETLDSKYQKTSREMDMFSIVKQLREKAESDEVRKEFAI
jgi:hypothetical protein